MMRSFIFILFAFLVLDLNAQYLISGKVTDKSNSPLAGATVYLPDLNKGTMTDASGNYTISDLPEGKIKIQFSYIGYINVLETVIIEKPVTEMNVALETTTVTTDEIVISAGSSSTQHENAVKIESLKLDLSQVKVTSNFTETLTNIPGVEMISKGAGVSKPVIRGLSMNDILVLNNGFRFENYQYSDHHPLGIDESGIEDVEVIKGPSSLLYGSDAIGGVINFIREKPAPLQTIEGDYNLKLFSNSLGYANNFGLKGSSKHISGGMRFGQKSNADYLQGGGIFVPNTRFSEYSVKLNAALTGKAGYSRWFYDYGKQNYGLAEPEAFTFVTERGRKINAFYQQFGTHMLSSQNKLYLGKMKLDLNPSFQNTELIHFGESGNYEIQMRLATFTWETKLYLPSGKNAEYIAGYQGMYQDNLNLNNRDTKLLPDASILNNSAFFLIQQTLIEKLKLQAGLRFDRKSVSTKPVGTYDQPAYRPAVDRNYDSFSGSAGFTYNFSESFLVRSNVASAFRTPNLAELTSNGQHELRYEIGDENLSPEKSYETDLSFHYHIDNLTIDLAGFFNHINNYIYISPTADTSANGIRIYRYEQGNSYLYGAEAGFHFHPQGAKWMHLLATYSSVKAKQENGNYLPFIPADRLYAEFRAEKKKLLFFNDAYFSIGATNVFRQDHPAPLETGTKGYSLADITFGGKLKIMARELSLDLSASNIFDTKYIDHLSTLKETGYFNQGRNIALSVRLPFEINK